MYKALILLIVNYSVAAVSPENPSFKVNDVASEVFINSTLSPLRREVALGTHNNLRAKHDSPPLEWDSELAKLAQSVANKLASTENLRSTTEIDDVGESIAAFEGGGLNEEQMTVNGIMDWYSQVKDYNFQEPETNWFHGVSHFAQIVWKSTTKFGFGLATNPKTGFTVIVAEYMPRGNVQDMFEVNVGKWREEHKRSRELK